jgi:hypothetical protein
VIDWLNEKFGEVEQLGIHAGQLGFVLVMVMTWFKTKALVPVIVTALVGGFVLFAVSNTGWFKQKVTDESGLGQRPVAVHVVYEAPSAVGPVFSLAA